MAVLTDKQIQAFLALDIGNGYGNGSGNGYGSGNGNGYGSGNGYGNGNGSGNGDGNGNGYGDGNGYSYGNGSGYGNGDGSGYGDGYGNGYGDGSGYGDGIQEFDGYKLYTIDYVRTAIISIRGNVVQGFVFEHNVFPKPCYIVKENGKFAHGSTLRDAFISLQEKLYDDSTEEERIAAFKSKFPDYDTPYANTDLFAFHHVLTGSCRMGRKQFVKNHSIDINGATTVRDFVELTKDSYGGSIIRRLPEAYGMAEQ